MPESIHNRNKERIGLFRKALYDCEAGKLRGQLRELFAPDCMVQLANPLETLPGVDGLFEQAYEPLLKAVPDLERRDFIVMAGETHGAGLGRLLRALYGRLRAALAGYSADAAPNGDALSRVFPP